MTYCAVRKHVDIVQLNTPSNPHQQTMLLKIVSANLVECNQMSIRDEDRGLLNVYAVILILILFAPTGRYKNYGHGPSCYE